MTFGSLFAGIGGMDLGLERSGMRCVWQVEIDDHARRVLARHWPDVRRWDDVRTFPPEPVDDWRCDLIAGGFPCQDISFAGKGAGLSGERSGLWYEFARVIRILRPRYVLVENVAALLVRGLDAVLGTLAADGYDAEWACIPAAAAGAPHLRERVFILAYANGIRMFQTARGCQALADTTSQRCKERRELQSSCLEDRIASGGPPLADTIDQRSQGLMLAGSKARTTLGEHRARCERESWGFDPAVQPESGMGRVADGVSSFLDGSLNDGNEMGAMQGGSEGISQSEALRAMRFNPSRPCDEAMAWGYTPRVIASCPNRVDRIRALGNAVVPQVAEWVGRRIMEIESMGKAGVKR